MITWQYEGKGHTYAVSDLHGKLDMYKQIVAFLKPEDQVICLGDCGDRGPNCWETLKSVYENPQFFLLKGNHEDMLVEALKDRFMYPVFPYDQAYHLLVYNGGKPTYDEFLSSNTPEEQKKWLQKLDDLPDRMIYINKDGTEVILTHSGYAPMVGDIPRDVIWNRRHFNTKWPKAKEYENVVLVHGHTPIEIQIADFMYQKSKWSTGAYWYCHDHKVNIDCGTVWNDQTVLLDLDTWDEHVFLGPEFKGEIDGEVEN